MPSPDFLKLRSAVLAYLYAVDQKKGWQSVDDGPRVVYADARRRMDEVLKTRSALCTAMDMKEVEYAVPDGILDALGVFDEAMKDHLRDCWLGSDDDEQVIPARYAAVRRAENNLMDVVRAYAGRHAREFEAQAERNRASAEEAIDGQA